MLTTRFITENNLNSLSLDELNQFNYNNFSEITLGIGAAIDGNTLNDMDKIEKII